MEPKIDLASITVGNEDDHMGGYEFTTSANDTINFGEINGISLLKTMQEIQIKLNILQPNTALEAEWEELYALGRKYKDLEQQIKEKQATWDRLKAMPPPELD